MKRPKVAIMQPYFFPYVGYFLLLKKVDVFVFLSDVQFPRRGWVHRNRIRSRQLPFQYIQVPVTKNHQTTPISEMVIANQNWQLKLLKSLRHTYSKKAPNSAWEFIQDFLSVSTSRLEDVVKRSVVMTAEFLGLNHLEFMDSKQCSNPELNGEERIVNICKELGASEYHNLPGGQGLYSPNAFMKNSIQLHIMEPLEKRLDHFKLNNLSILDPIFNGDIVNVKLFLEAS